MSPPGGQDGWQEKLTRPWVQSLLVAVTLTCCRTGIRRGSSLNLFPYL